MRKIRVMEFVESLEFGGGMERVVYDIARLLDPARFEVAVTCLTVPGEFAALLEPRGIEVLALGKQPGRALRLPFRYARMLRARRIDVVHMHNSGPLFTGTIAAIVGGVPGRVYTEHGRVWPDRERTMKIERALLSRVAVVTAVSGASTDSLCRHLGQCEPRLRVVRNGIEDPAATPATPPADLFEGRPGPTLGFVGRLEEVKGVDVLLESMVRLRDRHPTACLLAVGTGSLDEALKARAAELGIADRVRFTGLRADVPAIFRGLDLLVLPSRSEGLPMVLLEAFGLSVPVVATRVGGTPEIVEDGGTGLLVPPGDPDALAAAIDRALASPGLRKTLGANARRVFEERLDARRMVAAYESIFAEVFSSRERG